MGVRLYSVHLKVCVSVHVCTRMHGVVVCLPLSLRRENEDRRILFCSIPVNWLLEIYSHGLEPPRSWVAFFFFNSPGNLQLNLEVTECECIVKTFKPFCFFSHLPKLKNDQRGCDFLIPMDLADSCAEGRPRALAPGLAGAEGSLAQPLPPHEEWDPERPYLPLELLPPALALTFQTIFSFWSEPQWQPRSIIHNT